MRIRVDLRLEGALIASHPAAVRLVRAMPAAPFSVADIAIDTGTAVVMGHEAFGRLLDPRARETIERIVARSGLPAALDCDIGEPRLMGVVPSVASGRAGHVMAVDPALFPAAAAVDLDATPILELLTTDQFDRLCAIGEAT